ncbi:hypothetical protein CAPTEDRAFT_196718 [Capitella teleta]|uniref:N-acetyltransferase domain-containing protein n=1 Tax=Capitella teleta TaxID=283909 RepID=R7U844_CAPTE|nr:hypothetical protein CAPTEDRAFT_196718 [Capitella teleta]|eukprot:ELU02540.1 hypothetical protein CAPTEDRAFT_196718 [Capitella teleta]
MSKEDTSLRFRQFEADDAPVVYSFCLQLIFKQSCWQLRKKTMLNRGWMISAVTASVLLAIGLSWPVTLITSLLCTYLLIWISHTAYSYYLRHNRYQDLCSTAAFVARWCSGGQDRLFVATLEDGTVIASSGIVHQDIDTCELVRVATEESYQRKGVGRALMKYVLRQSTSFGYKTVVLKTSDVQTEAQRLYETSGFSLSKIYTVGRGIMTVYYYKLNLTDH